MCKTFGIAIINESYSNNDDGDDENSTNDDNMNSGSNYSNNKGNKDDDDNDDDVDGGGGGGDDDALRKKGTCQPTVVNVNWAINADRQQINKTATIVAGTGDVDAHLLTYCSLHWFQLWTMLPTDMLARSINHVKTPICLHTLHAMHCITLSCIHRMATTFTFGEG